MTPGRLKPAIERGEGYLVERETTNAAPPRTWLEEQLDIASREVAKWPEWKRKELEAWMRK